MWLAAAAHNVIGLGFCNVRFIPKTLVEFRQQHCQHTRGCHVAAQELFVNFTGGVSEADVDNILERCGARLRGESPG